MVKGKIVQGMKRGTQRGATICHVCRKEIETKPYRVPMAGMIGAHWQVCFEHREWIDYEHEGSV